MTTFDIYSTKYQTIRMERRDGILQLTFHTDGGPLRWGLLPHGEFPDAFADIARDRDNRVVILAGTGEEFSGVRASPQTTPFTARPRRRIQRARAQSFEAIRGPDEIQG